jgi:hypothetical protein
VTRKPLSGMIHAKSTASPVIVKLPSPEDETQLYAEDLVVGQAFSGKPHAIGESEFTAFAALTGDDHPIHYNDAFAAHTRFGKRVAHGLLLMSMTAFGATAMSRHIATLWLRLPTRLPLPGACICWRSNPSAFHRGIDPNKARQGYGCGTF